MCQTNHPDVNSCNSNEDCVWCDCEAVPSACFSKQSAPHLPELVYTCSSDAAATGESTFSEVIEEVAENVEQSWQATAEKATKVQSFLLDGVELNLATDEVASDFCDAASPLSLSGYMNGEFLLLLLLIGVYYYVSILFSSCFIVLFLYAAANILLNSINLSFFSIHKSREVNMTLNRTNISSSGCLKNVARVSFRTVKPKRKTNTETYPSLCG